MKISSKENPLIKYLTKVYSDKKERDQAKVYIVEGYNLVDEAIKSGHVKTVFITEENKLYPDAIIVTPDIIKKVTSTVNPEGIIALVNKCESAKIGNHLLYLDRLQDPGNIGTLLRSALAFNFDTVIMDECCDLYNPKVIRASEGSIFNLNFIDIKLNEIKKLGYYIIGTSMKGTPSNSYQYDQEKIALVLGNEGNGVRDEYLKLSNINLTIPMNKMESLNVGVAGSILMYEINKK